MSDNLIAMSGECIDFVDVFVQRINADEEIDEDHNQGQGRKEWSSFKLENCDDARKDDAGC